MADLSDITTYLATAVSAAVYPNGTSQPSVATMDCLIYEGWPIPDALDLDMAGNMKVGNPVVIVPRTGGVRANVSIFPMLGTGKAVYQIQDETYLITAPVINLTLSIANTVITVTNQPAVGEYITLVIDDAVVCSQTGANTPALLAALAAQAVTFGYAATSTSTTLTIPFGHVMVVRQGGVGVQGKVTHRQCHSVMISVWAPTRVSRTALASAIDVALKQTLKITLPDTSQAVMIYSRTNISDEKQSVTVYRRDLIYDIEYATLEQFPAFVVTSTATSIANPSNTAIALAIA